MKKLLLLLSISCLAPLASRLSAQGLVSDLTVQKTVKLTGKITPSQITSNQNDYDPTSLSTAAVVRISSDAARTITGLAGGSDGRLVWLWNVGAFTITLSNESSSSTAAYRFGFGQDHLLAAKNATLLIYDSTSSRWREAGSSADLSALNASNLTSGTVPNGRFPATLPATSGVNLTDLNASNLGSGTVPDGRFPASIPIATLGLFTEVSAPSTPASGKVILYAKADGILYSKDDAGTETPLAGSGTGTVTHTAGALTSNAVVLGAGAADTKVLAGFFTDGTSKLTLGEAGTSVGKLALANATSGTITLQPVTGALSSSVITVPAATDTMTLNAASQTLTNKTLTSPVVSGGTIDNATIGATTPTTASVTRLGINIAADGTTPLYLKQSNNSFTGGVRAIRSDTSGYSTWYMGGDAKGYFDNRDSGGWEFYGNAATRLGGFDPTNGFDAVGKIVTASTTASTSTTTGSGIFGGGIGVAGQVTAGGALKTTSTTASTSSTTGSGIFGGGVGIAGDLNVGGAFTIATHTPSSASDTGTAGTIAWDASYIYICTATDTWKRVAIATWP